MAEQNESSGSWADFPVLTDPAVTRVFDKVKTYQQEFDADPAVSDERIQEVLTDLNTNWPCNEEVAKVSGRVRSPIVDYEEPEPDSDTKGHKIALVGTRRKEDGSAQMCSYTINDQALWSDGFATEWKPFMVGGMEVGKHQVIKLLFSRTVYLSIPDEEEPRALVLQCITDIDNVTVEPERESYEFSRLRSHEYFPTAAEKLEELADTEDITAAQVILSLGKMKTVPAQAWMTNAELQSLTNFAQEIAGIDYEQVPFLMRLKEDTPLFDPDEFDDVLENMPKANFLVDVMGIRARPKVVFRRKSEDQAEIITKADAVEFRLAFKIRHRDSVHDSEEVEVRLRDIKNIKNIRELVYPNPVDSEEADEREV